MRPLVDKYLRSLGFHPDISTSYHSKTVRGVEVYGVGLVEYSVQHAHRANWASEWMPQATKCIKEAIDNLWVEEVAEQS